MASIGHLAVGAAIGAAYSRQLKARSWVAILTFAALALAPDFDLASRFLGVPFGSVFSHRGLTHSVFFALAIAGLVALLTRGVLIRRGVAGLCVFAALASHGLLDGMSRLGSGPLLFWPFTTASYAFPWRPIPGVLTSHHYLTLQAVPTLVVETLLFLPFMAYALTVLLPVGHVEKSSPVTVVPEG